MNLPRVGEIQVLAATTANLYVELLDQATPWTASLRLVFLAPVQDDCNQAHERQEEPDNEPDEKGAALGPGDQRGRDAKGQQDDDELHGDIVARARSAMSHGLAHGQGARPEGSVRATDASPSGAPGRGSR